MKKMLSLLLVLVMLLSMASTGLFFASAVTTEFAGGSGTEADPYLIETKTHLNNVRGYLDAHFKMVADVAFTDDDFASGGDFYNGGNGWLSIGTNKDAAFTGTFDGNGYSIKNLYINISDSSAVYAGLFGVNAGTVKNLGLVAGNMSVSTPFSAIYVGGIAGINAGTITNCYNTGDESASSDSSVYVGGIAGLNENATIKNCYNTGTVSASVSSSFYFGYVGGVTGYNLKSSIINSYNTGNVVTTAYLQPYAGGVAGENNQGTLTNCYYIDTISKGISYGTDTTTRCTPEEMKLASTFVGFDFETVWTFDDTLVHHPTPVLKNVKHVETLKSTTEYAGGSGTVFDPYLVSNKTHLNNIRNDLSAHFKMTCDIVFSDADFVSGGAFYNDGQGFAPIGTRNIAFSGTFDGNGYSIKNLYINISSSSTTVYAGLFGVINGTVKDLGIVDGNITASSYANSYAGGIAGWNTRGAVTNCYNTADVSAETYGGGIVGLNAGTITNCHNTGKLAAETYGGGIAGHNNADSTIANCYNTGKVSADPYCGGMAGYNGGTVIKCYNTGDVTGNQRVGGMVGMNDWGVVINCYNTGTVSACSTIPNVYGYAGGTVGYNCGVIEKCYNTGIVLSTQYAGGIAGSAYNGSIKNCYYADNILKGVDNGTDTTTKCTAGKMKQQSTYIGFDFQDVWTLAGNVCYPYPELKDVAFTSGHVFDNSCDTDCACNYKRDITHTYGGYVYNNDATLTKDGTKTRTCSVCGHKDTVTATGTKLIDSSKVFRDVPATEWYKPFVDFAVTQGIFNGTSGNTFEPGKDMTRAQFVQVFANIAGVDTSNKNVNSGFSDVPKGKWYTAAVTWASQKSIVNGVGGGRFAPEEKVTREQMCVMLVNYIENYLDKTMPNINNAAPFADDKDIASWAKSSVYKCAKAKLVNGVGNNKFAPKASATRAQGATIFTNFYKQYMK